MNQTHDRKTRYSESESRLIGILGTDEADVEDFRLNMEGTSYRLVHCTSLEHLHQILAAHPLRAVILDADTMALDNRIIRNLQAAHPGVSLLLASRKRFHPELQESISRTLYACLKKPADSDEIGYLLHSIHNHLHPIERT